MTIFETRRGILEIRELRSIADMVAAESIQAKVWGTDVIGHPKELFIPVQHEGGLLAGAFTAQAEMVGFIFSFPTQDPKAAHSQILATLEDWRGLGIGARLKWFQRLWYLERGVSIVRWTVDPLRAANAELNIRHLGGICSTYLPNYYGAMDGIDAGTASDRLLIEWQLESKHVLRHAESTPEDRGFPGTEYANPGSGNEVDASLPNLETIQLLIRLPEDFIRLAKEDRDLANCWRMQTRDLFLGYFSKGYELIDFTRVGGPAYLLRKGLDR
jgi:chorismate synthase